MRMRKAPGRSAKVHNQSYSKHGLRRLHSLTPVSLYCSSHDSQHVAIGSGLSSAMTAFVRSQDSRKPQGQSTGVFASGASSRKVGYVRLGFSLIIKLVQLSTILTKISNSTIIYAFLHCLPHPLLMKPFPLGQGLQHSLDCQRAIRR